MNRELGAAVLLCLVGAFLVLVGAGRDWAVVDVAGTGLLPSRRVGVAGSDLAGGVRALGLVGLAGVVALAATRRWGRVVVGVLLALVGLGVLALVAGTDLAAEAVRSVPVAQAGGPAEGVRPTGWRAVTGAGGLLLAAAGALVAVRGRRWAGLGRRYDAPAARPAAVPTGPAQLWDALDRGEDPTEAHTGPADATAGHPGPDVLPDPATGGAAAPADVARAAPDADPRRG